MPERRYDEAEVAAIFERATKTPQTGEHQLPSGEGLTLAQLQDIGREVGIGPDEIREAAKLVVQRGQPASRRFLGLPLGVGRTIELERKLTESEWERLVVYLRETFDARGSVRSEGSLRQWTNGNLQALLEPTPTGHRVRLRTMKGQSLGLMMGGLVVLGGAAVTFLIAALMEGGDVAEKLRGAAGLLVVGAGMFGLGALQLPAWARLRRRQMEQVAERLAEVAGSPPVETR